MVTRLSDVHKGWLDTSDTPFIQLQGLYSERMEVWISRLRLRKGRIVITPLEDLGEGEAVW